MEPLQIDTVGASPGQKRCGYADVDVGIAHIRLPIVLANGTRPGPRLAVTSGLHYGEFVGVEALRELVRVCDPASLSGQVVACPLACPPSWYVHHRASPLDGLDPNRVYPGDRAGRPTERLVAWIFEHLICGSDVFVDLHSGGVTMDLVPFAAYRSSGNAEQDRMAVDLAESFGLPVVRGAAPTGGNSHAAATRSGVVSLLVEMGARGSRCADEVKAVGDGLLQLMKRLEMIADAPAAAPTRRRTRWLWGAEVEAPAEGLWYPEFEVGADVHAGDQLGRIVDPFDQVVATVAAPTGGRVFYGERSLAVARGNVLAAIAAPDTT